MPLRAWIEILPEVGKGAPAVLDERESHHLVRVRRAGVGDAVSLFDGRGGEAAGVVAEAHPKAARVALERCWRVPPPARGLVLLQAMPAGGAMETIVEKAAELGAKAVWPLVSARTEVALKGERAAAKTEKWRLLAREAGKQCGGSHVPEIRPPRPFAEVLREARAACAVRWVAALTPEARPPAPELCGPAGDLALLVGPEGDFTPAEYADAAAAGFTPLTLGPVVLRADTAAIVFLALAGHCLRARHIGVA